MARKCRHLDYLIGKVQKFNQCVAFRYCDSESHGGLSWTHTCTSCGKVRRCNRKGHHVEYSLWKKPEVVI